MNNYKAEWQQFKEFRLQVFMPKLYDIIRIGDNKAFLYIHLRDLKIEEDAILEYSWRYENKTLYESFSFNGGLFFRTNKRITNIEKETFVKNWFNLHKDKFLHWGYLLGDTESMNVENMGWTTIDNLNIFLSDKFAEQKLINSAGYESYNEAKSLCIMLNQEAPLVYVKFFNNGIYTISLESYPERIKKQLNLKDCPEGKPSMEEEENQNAFIHNKMIPAILDYLQNYTVIIEPEDEVMPLD